MKLLFTHALAFMASQEPVLANNLRRQNVNIHSNTAVNRLLNNISGSNIFADTFMPHPSENESHDEQSRSNISDLRREGEDEVGIRIVGGDSSDKGEFPYFVDMLEAGCGGTLIAPRVVLTAAHCDKDNDKFIGNDVLIGAFENDDEDHGAIRVEADRQELHPKYGDGHSKAYDFLLVRLEEPVHINEPRASISDNDDKDSPAAGTDLRAIGLGRLDFGGDRPDFLRDVEVPVVDIDECKDMYAEAHKDIEADIMFCAGDVEDGGEDSCQGDSGGPIVFEESDSKHVLIGVVSWGKGCAEEDYPGVYAKVGAAYNWIQSVVCDEWDVEADFCDEWDGDEPDEEESEEEPEEESAPDCHPSGAEGYDADYGTCDTYRPGEKNHKYCSEDEDDDGIKAEDACTECGKCIGEEYDSESVDGGGNFNPFFQPASVP